jgi:signal peptidase II
VRRLEFSRRFAEIADPRRRDPPLDARNSSQPGAAFTVRQKLKIFGIIFPVILALDLATKSWALDALADNRRIELLGGLLPLSLAFNRNAAFGLGFGDDTRWFFVPVTILALILLGSLFRQADRGDVVRHTALSLVIAGAIGNLYDRVRWNRGVVDFIGPVNLVFWDFPIFNVADSAITCGAVLLAISFWNEEREAKRLRLEAGDGGDATAVSDGGQGPVAGGQGPVAGGQGPRGAVTQGE